MIEFYKKNLKQIFFVSKLECTTSIQSSKCTSDHSSAMITCSAFLIFVFFLLMEESFLGGAKGEMPFLIPFIKQGRNTVLRSHVPFGRTSGHERSLTSCFP